MRRWARLAKSATQWTRLATSGNLQSLLMSRLQRTRRGSRCVMHQPEVLQSQEIGSRNNVRATQANERLSGTWVTQQETWGQPVCIKMEQRGCFGSCNIVGEKVKYADFTIEGKTITLTVQGEVTKENVGEIVDDDTITWPSRQAATPQDASAHARRYLCMHACRYAGCKWMRLGAEAGSA